MLCVLCISDNKIQGGDRAFLEAIMAESLVQDQEVETGRQLLPCSYFCLWLFH